MLDRITGTLQFQAEALALRAQRQQVLASNIANADTPNYQARDFDFGQALAQATARLGSGLARGGGSAGLARAGGAGLAHGGGASESSPAVSTMRVALAQPDAGVAQGKAFLPVSGTGPALRPQMLWRTPEQPSLDRNTVDLDRERASFADNSLRYEATLRFINGGVRNVLSAIRGE